MNTYRPPLQDMQFVLEHICDVRSLSKLEAFGSFDPDSVEDILTGAGRFFSEVFAPLNRTGDTTHSVRNDDGTVTTPPGFREAYEAYVDAGWGAAAFGPELGGGGLPWAVGLALQEMMTASNLALSLCPLLTQGGIHLLDLHASPAQRAEYLPKLVAGEWTATMLLTEPHAGSDLGALTTRAEQVSDGSYRLRGQKIFITWGEHDMAANTIHLVLARTPDAPVARGESRASSSPSTCPTPPDTPATATTSPASPSSTSWASTPAPRVSCPSASATAPWATSSARRTWAWCTCSP